MRTGRIEIILLFALMWSCKQKDEINVSSSSFDKILNQWIEAQMLHQKFLAERKFKDSIQCFFISDGLNLSQRDSVIRYWSEHPQELLNLTNEMLNGR